VKGERERRDQKNARAERARPEYGSKPLSRRVRIAEELHQFRRELALTEGTAERKAGAGRFGLCGRPGDPAGLRFILFDSTWNHAEAGWATAKERARGDGLGPRRRRGSAM